MLPSREPSGIFQLCVSCHSPPNYRVHDSIFLALPAVFWMEDANLHKNGKNPFNTNAGFNSTWLNVKTFGGVRLLYARSVTLLTWLYRPKATDQRV
jgi:hypothetical protein